MNYKTEIAFRNIAVSISHEECSSFGTPASGVLLLKASNCELKTLTRIEINGEQLERVIFVHWDVPLGGVGFGILLDEETATLFVGAGTISASIDFRNMRVINENVVDLFWTFKRVGEWVLELGELECYLYTPSGSLVASVPVDPPYDYYETDEGIRFETSIYGTQWLYFPK